MSNGSGKVPVVRIPSWLHLSRSRTSHGGADGWDFRFLVRPPDGVGEVAFEFRTCHRDLYNPPGAALGKWPRDHSDKRDRVASGPVTPSAIDPDRNHVLPLDSSVVSPELRPSDDAMPELF
jgi:hypothetical protein